MVVIVELGLEILDSYAEYNYGPSYNYPEFRLSSTEFNDTCK